MIKLYPQKFTLVSQIILAFVLLSSLGVSSQTFTDSNLPIVIITTDTGSFNRFSARNFGRSKSIGYDENYQKARRIPKLSYR